MKCRKGLISYIENGLLNQSLWHSADQTADKVEYDSFTTEKQEVPTPVTLGWQPSTGTVCFWPSSHNPAPHKVSLFPRSMSSTSRKRLPPLSVSQAHKVQAALGLQPLLSCKHLPLPSLPLMSQQAPAPRQRHTPAYLRRPGWTGLLQGPQVRPHLPPYTLLLFMEYDLSLVQNQTLD